MEKSMKIIKPDVILDDAAKTPLNITVTFSEEKEGKRFFEHCIDMLEIQEAEKNNKPQLYTDFEIKG